MTSINYDSVEFTNVVDALLQIETTGSYLELIGAECNHFLDDLSTNGYLSKSLSGHYKKFTLTESGKEMMQYLKCRQKETINDTIAKALNNPSHKFAYDTAGITEGLL
jgi:hypothetical protein